MITDNYIHPKTYEATKIMDTFPLGVLKVTLGQSHYNEHTDLCGRVCIPEIDEERDKDFGTLPMHMICDYYKSSLPPVKPKDIDVEWKLEPIGDKIRVEQDMIQIKAVSNVDTTIPCKWHFYVDNTEYQFDDSDLTSYFDFYPTDPNTISSDVLNIKVINKVMIGYAIKIVITDEYDNLYDSVEMEVVDG